MKNFIISVLIFGSLNIWATDYYVNNVIGNDKLDGKSASVSGRSGPMASINKAVKLLQPGTGCTWRIPGKFIGRA